MVWERLVTAVTGRRSWLVALGDVLIDSGFMALSSANAAVGRAPVSTFVVRTLIIPALFALIGDRTWWPADV